MHDRHAKKEMVPTRSCESLWSHMPAAPGAQTPLIVKIDIEELHYT